MRTILEANSLYKTFSINKENQVHVLSNINLQIKAGEFVSLMGPSGSGKSTLLYTISGMDRMTSGNIHFDDIDLAKMSEKELSKLRLTEMGFIFQQIHLLKNLSIFDNITITAYLVNTQNADVINSRAIELMDKMGIKNLANRSITEASGGQLQRVAICRSLINQPKIIFGDEPTGALNSQSAQDIMDILVNINHQLKTTIFIATHDIKVALRSERVIYIIDGKIMSELQLNKYKQSQIDYKKREALLSKWLFDLGF